MSGIENRPYRLGLDLGSNSLGWFVVWLDEKGRPAALGPGGVRVYADGRDPQSKASNAVQRRIARGARRRRDRYLRRRHRLMQLLIKYGLMPEDRAARKALESLDPYELRATALDFPLPAHHVGRALFHLNQRRGFLSNRKTEGKDREAGAIREGIGKLQAAMEASGARTLGEFLYGRHRARKTVRVRSHSAGPKAEYDLYPTRRMAMDEFDAIWRAQAPHHASMTAQARTDIAETIFMQRPLKSPPVGKCSLDPADDIDDLEGFRCPWAHPLAQRFRIWQEVRNLAIGETGALPRPLTKDQGDLIALALLQNAKLTFDMIRGLLKLGPETRFNLESEKRKELLGDQTAAKLAGKALFGKTWRSLDLARQIEIVRQLLSEEDEAQLMAWLVAEAGVDQSAAGRIASALLPDGYCRLGLRAIKKILPLMEGGMNYPEAAKAAGYDHALLPDGETSATGYLPYYGEWLRDDVLGTGDPTDRNERRWGRFPNPTVHIGLGQLRRIVNALIRAYGPPAEVAIEMTRAFKLSPQQLAMVEQEQAENQRKNELRRAELRRLELAENARNVLKLRLWEELNPHDPLDRRCPFSGEVINIARLFSEEVEIEHLIPFQDSWDDSASNKVVCLRAANRLKGKQTPFEAFGASPEWPEIAARAAGLPKAKRWRFQPNARQHFDSVGGFLPRQLNETGWLARVAKRYLGAVADPNRIHVLPGKLTAMIRAKWGLNTLLPDHNYGDEKNRKDHRHHAIDALVAALTDRALLLRMSSAYDDERDRIDVPLPWASLRADLDTRLQAMIVSHKPDHGLATQLHEDTAHGAIERPDLEEGNLVYRKPFLLLTEREIERIRDQRLKDLLKAHLATEKAAGKDLKSALQSFAVRTDIAGLPNGIRHVRLTKSKDPEFLVPVRNSAGEAYKFYIAGENAYVDIFETADGEWRGQAVSIFQANQKNGHQPSWRRAYPDGRFVMRVFKGDSVALDLNGHRTVMTIHRLDAAAGRFKLAPHNEAGNLDRRHDDESDPFRWLMASYGTLKKLNTERVRVDELGRLWRVRADDAADAS
jgi:CRISPR-associated endonuclease Csn1